MKGQNTKNVVMVVDDDLFMRKIISTALKDFATIVEVSDGADVLEQYKTRNPDIVFLDIHLPSVNGTKLVEALVKIDKDACIIMLSADSSEDNVKNTMAKGAKGFLTKPFDKKRVMHHFTQCKTIKFADNAM